MRICTGITTLMTVFLLKIQRYRYLLIYLDLLCFLIKKGLDLFICLWSWAGAMKLNCSSWTNYSRTSSYHVIIIPLFLDGHLSTKNMLMISLQM